MMIAGGKSLFFTDTRIVCVNEYVPFRESHGFGYEIPAEVVNVYGAFGSLMVLEFFSCSPNPYLGVP